MAKRRRIPVFEVFIGSIEDEHLGDRSYQNGRRHVLPYKLPVRGRYIVEARGPVVALKRAIALAREDGIPLPVNKGWRRLDIHCPGADEIFDGLMGTGDE